MDLIFALIILWIFYNAIVSFYIGIPMIAAIIGLDRGWYKGRRDFRRSVEYTLERLPK